MATWEGAPLPPVPYEDFQITYPEPELNAFFRPVDAPRITPPPPSSLFATSESESLAHFLHDFEDNSDFLFQPALPPGIPSFDLLDTGSFAPPPPPLPLMADPVMQGIDMEPIEEPPSAKRYKMEVPSAPPALIQPAVDEMQTDQQVDTASDTDTHRSRQASRNTQGTSPTASTSSQTSVEARRQQQQAQQRALLTEEEKRSNHIQSEQKRRNAIRDGFAELVTILQTGEPYSGLSIGHDGEDAGNGKKSRGRGRGRKGDHAASASKSVVLAQAVKYVAWLQTGNEALEQELARLEAVAGVA